MSLPLTRRAWLASVAGLGATMVAPRAVAAGFPNHPITLWVPWAAGGATDITLRLLAELASVHLGQRVLIENRGGAGGTLAMPILQNADPNGYTIAQIPQPVLRVPFMQKVLWDPVRDVTPIIQISGVTFGVLVPANSRFRSLDDLFEFARAHPGELSIATNGIGTTPHVVLEELFGARRLNYIHIPYKGTSELLIAVDSRQVMAGVNSTGFAPFVDSGQLRLLATFAAQRSKRWAQVPTLKELGHNIVAMSPYGLGGPRGLPAPIVATLHDAFKKAMFDPQFVNEIAKYDQEIDYLGPVEYGQWLREQYARERAATEGMGLSRGGT